MITILKKKTTVKCSPVEGRRKRQKLSVAITSSAYEPYWEPRKEVDVWKPLPKTESFRSWVRLLVTEPEPNTNQHAVLYVVPLEDRFALSDNNLMHCVHLRWLDMLNVAKLSVANPCFTDIISIFNILQLDPPLRKKKEPQNIPCLGCGRMTWCVGCRTTVALRCTGAAGATGAAAFDGSWDSVGGGRSTRYMEVDWDPCPGATKVRTGAWVFWKGKYSKRLTMRLIPAFET